MTELFGASSIKLDYPMSRTANPEWYPQYIARITEATVPLFKFPDASGKVTTFINQAWHDRIVQVNSANPKGDQIFNPAFGPFNIKGLMLSIVEEGNLLRFTRLDYAYGHRVGILMTYHTDQTPPADEDFISRPDKWQKCTNINQYDQLLEPVQGDLYWPLLTDPDVELYINLDMVETWPILPVTVTVRMDITGLNARSAPVYPANNIVKTYAPGSSLIISKYAAVGCWIWGKTQESLWVALRVVISGSNIPTYFTDWKLATPPPFGPKA